MYTKTNSLASYKRVAHSESDPLQQVVMLYDGAIKFLKLAATDIESGDIAQKATHVNRALDILNYLQSILDFEKGGEVATTLDRLYSLVSLQVIQASAKLDAQSMQQAADLLAPVRESWTVAANRTEPQAPATALNQPTPRLGHLVVG
jgi:flagellar protein FliS